MHDSVERLRQPKRILKALRIPKIDSYVFGEIWGPFIGSLGFLIFLGLMFQTLRSAELLIVHGVSLGIIAKIAALSTLVSLPMTFPFSFLIAVLMAYGRLSADSEITAIRACGVGITRASRAAIVFATGVALISFFLNMTWGPFGERGLRDVIYRVGNTKVASAIREGTFTTGFFDLLIFADKVDSKLNKLRRVFLYDERERSNAFVVVAQEGQIAPVQGDSDLEASAVLNLRDGAIHRSDSQKSYERIDFSNYQVFLAIQEGAGFGEWRINILDQKELFKTLRETKEPQLALEIRVEIWRRIHLALGAFVFLVAGIGFGTLHIRSARSSAALVTFLILLPYWTLLSFGTTWSIGGYIPAWFGTGLGNFVTLAAGIFAYRRVAAN